MMDIMDPDNDPTKAPYSEETDKEKEAFDPVNTDMTQDFKISVEEHEGIFDPNRVKFLVYAESGVGKTVFASTWPDVIFVDIDKGMSSIKKKVHRIGIDSWEDLQNAYMFLAYGKHHYKTAVIDSLNELQHIAMRNVVDSYKGIRRSYDSLPSQSDYGKMLDDFDKFVRYMRGLPMNVVFISNSSTPEYETDIIQPQLVGKNTAKNVSRMMDVVGYLYKIESNEPTKVRVMIFDSVQYVTKDRSSKLPPTLKNPDYNRLYEHWTSE